MIRILLLLLPLQVWATVDPFAEYRLCLPVVRAADGTIYRSSAIKAAFQRLHPCPSTGLQKGSCPGWSIDHVIPLAVGGCDAVVNMQWLPDQIKSAAGTYPKDRWERKVYADPMQIVK
jgi:hypothetical protein